MVTGTLVHPSRNGRLMLALVLLLVLTAAALVAAHVVLAGAPVHMPFLQHLRASGCAGGPGPC
jgi:hypothetical protein